MTGDLARDWEFTGSEDFALTEQQVCCLPDSLSLRLRPSRYLLFRAPLHLCNVENQVPLFRFSH